MKIAYAQLTQHLTKTLAPIYLISGDEPLLMQEAIDAIRIAAAQAGFSERISITAEAKNEWVEALYTAMHGLSLFSNKKIIELNLNQIKLNNTHVKILEEYASKPITNTLLLIRTAKLDAKIEKTAGYQAMTKSGIAVPIWPISTEQLPQWILQRAKKLNVQLTLHAAERLATLVEGNLLAASQEIEKISLIYANTTLDHHVIENSVMDNARFDIFNLVDSALLGDSARCLRILKNLADEGVEATLVLWALTRELRTLIDIKKQLQQGIALTAVLNKMRIWEKRQAGFKAFLQRHTHSGALQLLISAAKIDRTIKGIEAGNIWNALQAFAMQITQKEISPCLL